MTVAAAAPSPAGARSPSKGLLIWIARVAVSITILGVIFYIVPFEAVLAAARNISPLLWIGSLAAFLAGHAFSAVKWRMLIGGGVSLPSAFRAHLAGLAANLALPGVAGGDVVRAGLVYREADDKARLAVGSFADRILDTIGLAVIAAAGGLIAFSGGDDAPIGNIALIGGLAVAGLVGLFAAAVIADRKLAGSPPSGKIGRLAAKAAAAAAGLARQPGKLAACLAISMAVQSLFVLININLARAAGLDAPVSAWFFAWSGAKIIAIAPISFGGLGVREASMAALMQPFGAPAGQVIAVGLVWQTLLYASGALGALVQLVWKPSMSVTTETLDRPAAATAAAPARRAGLKKPEVVVLGAGPAGVGAGLMLQRSGKANATVLERQDRVGGNSGSFMIDGIHVDFGSHRLHPASEPHILDMIKDAVGEDLLWRPRHGRILLKKRWIHFPLKPVDLILRLPKGFTFALLFDMATKPLRKIQGEVTFKSVLLKGLGPAMSRAFYFPYMKKLWALDPEDLAVTLAQRRISGSSIGKIIGKILRQVPGFKSKKGSGFFYPRKGFGQISEAMRDAAVAEGADFEMGASVKRVEHKDGKITAVVWEQDGKEVRREPAAVWSSLPISHLIRMMDPPAPAHVLEAAQRIKYRGMILIYLVLETDQFTEYDAHYFPELSMPIARMSEPKNYSASTEPKGLTVLCAELPCDPGEELWGKTDDELGDLMRQWLGQHGLPVTAKVRKTLTRRLGFAYPVYDRTFEENFRVMDEWIGSFEGLLTYGRQGLFAHDNTHHALAMAHGAVDCLDFEGNFDKTKWAAYREVFETHVVED